MDSLSVSSADFRHRAFRFPFKNGSVLRKLPQAKILVPDWDLHLQGRSFNKLKTLQDKTSEFSQNVLLHLQKNATEILSRIALFLVNAKWP